MSPVTLLAVKIVIEPNQNVSTEETRLCFPGQSHYSIQEVLRICDEEIQNFFVRPPSEFASVLKSENGPTKIGSHKVGLERSW